MKLFYSLSSCLRNMKSLRNALKRSLTTPRRESYIWQLKLQSSWQGKKNIEHFMKSFRYLVQKGKKQDACELMMETYDSVNDLKTSSKVLNITIRTYPRRSW